MYRLLKPLIFKLDPERAHGLANLWLRATPRLPARLPGLPVQAFGLSFPNPLGLAAGMDKGQVLASAWFRMGFGHVEIGTVTPRPQGGNPRPRLFRLVEHQAVINRMGFNNDGAGTVAGRLRRVGKHPGPLGINIGKNKDTPNDRAVEDYVAAFRSLAPHADYVTLNVSSPNTPGLRALQSGLTALVGAVVHERETIGHRLPILVKLSPDEANLEEMAVAAVDAGADGIVATNTTLDRDILGDHVRAAEAGGLSGAPLREKASESCRRLYRAVGKRVPIVGVGGISTAEDAYARIRAGATLVQLYTALIYQGPGLPRRIVRGLLPLLRRDGLSIADAVGKDA